MGKRILQGIIIVNILLLLIAGCNKSINKREQDKLADINLKNLSDNEQKQLSVMEGNKKDKIYKRILVDKEEIFNLYIKDNGLHMSYEDKNIFLNNIDKTQTEIRYKVLSDDKEEMYVVVYYSYLHCGGAGKYIPFHVVRIDKEQQDIDYIFSESKLSINSIFIKDKLHVTINNIDEIIIDTKDIIDKLGYEKKKDIISKGRISLHSTSALEVNDYIGNNRKQLFIRCQVGDITNSVELGYVYMILGIQKEKVKILKVFEEDLNNTIVNSIGENSYWKITEEDKNKDLIDRLIKNGVVRKQGKVLVFLFK